jgi:hypothetical protein
MIEMLRIYSEGFLENVTIEDLTPWSFQGLPGRWLFFHLSPKATALIPFSFNKIVLIVG